MWPEMYRSFDDCHILSGSERCAPGAKLCGEAHFRLVFLQLRCFALNVKIFYCFLAVRKYFFLPDWCPLQCSLWWSSACHGRDERGDALTETADVTLQALSALTTKNSV